jgi:predicted GNAT superfamily acetyltransferase
MARTSPQVDPSAMEVSLEIRELTELQELVACESIQRAVWQLTDTELVPVGQLRAAQHAGGLAAGAWLGSDLIGFSYGFPAYRPDSSPPHGLHSHMTAVLAKARGLGVGRALKWFQREWCTDRDLLWVEWTFDPLRAANAKLNLEYLGARVDEYLPDAYGPMEDALNSGLPSDRLVARWRLDAPWLDGLRRGEERAWPEGTPRPVLPAEADGLPGEPVLGAEAPLLTVSVPADLSVLLSERPKNALAWRVALRRTLTHYLDAGYTISRFRNGLYLLERPG